MKIKQKLAWFLKSRLFFGITLLVFFVESAWIALSSRYPMAFDESYHLGIIQLYAKQWSPIFNNLALNTSQYGALSRDPSYLFHYLMSFPYRLLIHITNFQNTVIVLRFIDIFLFGIGLLLFWKILKKTKASPDVINVAFLFFVLVPIVPLLAGQINYDDMLFPAIAWVLLLTVRFKENLSKGNFNLPLLIQTVALALLSSVITFPYLPILTAEVLYICLVIYQFKKKRSWSKVFVSAKKSWRSKPITLIALISLTFLAGVSSFIYFYGINIIEYQNPIPQCNQVLSIKACSAYAPWDRNYQDWLNKKPTVPNPIIFTGGWIYGMFERSFFSINGPGEPNSYQVQNPLPVVSVTAISIFCYGIYLCIRYRKEVFENDQVLILSLFLSTSYLIALWGRNFHDYVNLGQWVAINGRYLLMIILPILIAIGKAYDYKLKNNLVARDALVVITLVLFLNGGGIIAYIYGSNNTWYWPNNRSVDATNKRARNIIKNFIID